MVRWSCNSFVVFINQPLSLSHILSISQLSNENNKLLQSSLTVCNSMDCSLPGSSVHGIFQARTLGWVAISYPRGSSWLRDWTHNSCIGRWVLYHCATWEAPGGLLEGFTGSEPLCCSHTNFSPHCHVAHESVIWRRQERNGSFWQLPTHAVGEAGNKLTHIFLSRRNHQLRRSLLALSCATLGEG